MSIQCLHISKIRKLLEKEAHSLLEIFILNASTCYYSSKIHIPINITGKEIILPNEKSIRVPEGCVSFTISSNYLEQLEYGSRNDTINGGI